MTEGGARDVLPWLLEGLSARLEGLFGEVRVRGGCREPRRRMVGRLIFALGGYGIATGEACEVGIRNKFPWFALREGDSGEEMKGLLGEYTLDGKSRKSELLDGERDRDRRSCLIAELAFT
jgi:hypothetical protein